MSTRLPSRTLFSLLVLLAGAAHAAEIYRWTDDQGRVHYSQTPPADAQAQRVEPTPGTRGATLATEGMTRFNEQRAEQRDTKRKADRTEREAEARQAAACAAAQRRLAALDARTARRLAIKQADGSMARASEEQFQALRAEAQQVIDQAC